jgi:hypothetical protein
MPDVNEFRSDVSPYDHPLRYFVPSRTPGAPPYVVELDAYDGNGTCQCKDFAIRFEPLLSRGFTPQMALDSGLVDKRPDQRPKDVLRCFHILTGRDKFTDDQIARYIQQRKEHAKPLPTDALPQ